MRIPYQVLRHADSLVSISRDCCDNHHVLPPTLSPTAGDKGGAPSLMNRRVQELKGLATRPVHDRLVVDVRQ